MTGKSSKKNCRVIRQKSWTWLIFATTQCDVSQQGAVLARKIHASTHSWWVAVFLLFTCKCHMTDKKGTGIIPNQSGKILPEYYKPLQCVLVCDEPLNTFIFYFNWPSWIVLHCLTSPYTTRLRQLPL